MPSTFRKIKRIDSLDDSILYMFGTKIIRRTILRFNKISVVTINLCQTQNMRNTNKYGIRDHDIINNDFTFDLL